MTERKNKAYFDNIRRNNPSEYFSPKVQLELMRQAMRQGEAFYEKGPSIVPDAPAEESDDFNDDEDFEGDDE